MHHKRRAHALAVLTFAIIGLSAAPIGAADLYVDSVTSRYHTATLFHEHSESSWQISDYRTEASFSGRDLGTSWQLGVAYIEPWGDLRWGDRFSAGAVGEPSRLAGRIAFAERRLGLGLTGGWLDETVSARLDWQESESGLIDYAATMRVAPFGAIEIGLARSRTNPAPSYSELFYTYDSPGGGRDREGGRLFWEVPVWSTTVDVCLCPIEGLQVKSWHRESSFTPTTPTYGEKPLGYYSLLVDGDGLESSVEATYRPDTTWMFHARVERGRLDARLRAFDGGAQFAYFGIVAGEASQFAARIQRGWLNLGIRDGYLEGRVQGVVKAWPFADGLLRFLGERRHIVADGRVDWRWGTIDATVLDRQRWTLTVGADYARISPDMKYQTWRPVALGFGIDDLQGESLDLTRADLVQLRLAPTVRFHTFAVSATIAQWIPIDSRKRSDAEPGGGTGGGSGPSSASSSSQSLWGGFTASVAISTAW